MILSRIFLKFSISATKRKFWKNPQVIACGFFVLMKNTRKSKRAMDTLAQFARGVLMAAEQDNCAVMFRQVF
jgi:hypothetical protein